MAKEAIKNENITSFGGIYHIMTFFQSSALKNLPNLYWENVEVVVKHSVMEVFSALSSSAIFATENVLRILMHF